MGRHTGGWPAVSDQVPSADDEFVGFVREYLLQVVTIHHELMRRMILAEPGVARDLANLLDDAANTYRGLSAMISASNRAPPGVEED